MKQWKKSFIRTIPVLTGYLVLGASFGIVMQSKGFGVLWSIGMSAAVFAGSMQFVAVDLLATAAGIITTALTTLMVNARHLFYGVSMVDRYHDAGKAKPYLIFALTDETYSLLSDGKTPEGGDPDLYRFLVSAFNQSYWVCGCVLGNCLGPILPFSTKGIEFSMTALFVASFVEQWLTSADHIPALVGLGCTLLCLLLFGAENFLIPAMLLITLLLLLFQKRLKAEEVRR